MPKLIVTEPEEECTHEEHEHFVCSNCGANLDVGEMIDCAMDALEDG